MTSTCCSATAAKTSRLSGDQDTCRVMTVGRPAKSVTGIIGPPEVGISQTFDVAPSSSGNASHFPSGERVHSPKSSGSLEAGSRTSCSAGPFSGTARHTSVPQSARGVLRSLKYSTPSRTAGSNWPAGPDADGGASTPRIFSMCHEDVSGRVIQPAPVA